MEPGNALVHDALPVVGLARGTDAEAENTIDAPDTTTGDHTDAASQSDNVTAPGPGLTTVTSELTSPVHVNRNQVKAATLPRPDPTDTKVTPSGLLPALPLQVSLVWFNSCTNLTYLSAQTTLLKRQGGNSDNDPDAKYMITPSKFSRMS